MELNDNSAEQRGLLDDLKPDLVQAGHGKRLVNYFVDIIAFNVLFLIVLFIAANIHPQSLDWMDRAGTTGFTLIEQLLVIVSYGTYMFITEAIFKGKSLGKLITGTRVVKQDGSPITVRDAQLRGLCRMIPFHPLSALGMPCYPWHDRWTKTWVIDEKASRYKMPVR